MTEYRKVPLAWLKPYDNNPRDNEKAVPDVAESIRQVTYITPIVTDEDGVILAGHARYKALSALGYEEIQVLQVDDLTEEQKTKYRYLDNKTGEKATWDLVLLVDELSDLDLEDFDFFGVEADDEAIQKVYEAREPIEINTEVYDDDNFKYTCPKCGFKFN